MGHADRAVLSEEREKAKRVTYGIIYGLSAWGLAKGPGGLGIQVGQAQNLITSFLNHFSGVCHLPHWPCHLCRVCIPASFVMFMQQLCMPSEPHFRDSAYKAWQLCCISYSLRCCCCLWAQVANNWHMQIFPILLFLWCSVVKCLNS